MLDGWRSTHDILQFAFESIGAKMIVDPQLIGGAVTALKGNESVRFANMKLLVGIQSGGLVAKLRESSACVRTFLLLTALKACSYDEQEISDILYQIMVTAGLLDQVAVAPRQLKDIVRALSGHAESMLPSVLAHNMDIVNAMSTSPIQCTQICWQKIAEKDIGKLLTNAFDAIQSDEYDCTELSGSVGSIRLANILLWLNPSEAGLFAGEDCIYGSKHGKVKIMCSRPSLTVAKDDPGWSVKCWKALKTTTSVIKGGVDNEEYIAHHTVSNLVPLASIRNFYADFFITSEKLDQIGGFAAALLDCILEYGAFVHEDLSQHTHNPDAFARGMKRRAALRQLWPRSFLNAVKDQGEPWKSWGWNPGHFEQCRASVRKQLFEYVSSERAKLKPFFEASKRKTMYHDILINDGVEVPIDDIKRCSPRTAFEGIISSNYAAPPTKDKLLLQIEALVASALLISQQRPIGNLILLYNPSTHGDWIWSAIGPIGLILPVFREMCLKFCIGNVPKKNMKPSNDIILASQGRVVFPFVLHGHSNIQEDALAVSVIAGAIQYQEHNYERVREDESKDDLRYANQRRIHPVRTAFDHAEAIKGQIPLQSKAPYDLPSNPSQTEFTHLFAISGDSLFLKTRLSSTHPKRPEFHEAVSYCETALNIAMAEHLDDEAWHGIYNMESMVPSEFLKEVCLVECECPALHQEDVSIKKLVTLISHNYKQRFFAADPSFSGPLGSRKLRIQQHMPLADCVRIMVEDEDTGDKLITKGNL